MCTCYSSLLVLTMYSCLFTIHSLFFTLCSWLRTRYSVLFTRYYVLFLCYYLRFTLYSNRYGVLFYFLIFLLFAFSVSLFSVIFQPLSCIFALCYLHYARPSAHWYFLMLFRFARFASATLFTLLLSVFALLSLVCLLSFPSLFPCSILSVCPPPSICFYFCSFFIRASLYFRFLRYLVDALCSAPFICCLFHLNTIFDIFTGFTGYVFG